MVLKDDAFNSIIAAMRQGRVIFNNIRRFVVYLMSCNLSEIMVVGFAILAGFAAPIIPLQILFLNIVTDVFPAFAVGLGEDEGDVMKQPPRDPKKSIIEISNWVDIFVFGASITIATLGVYWVALVRFEMVPEEATTLAFLTLALAQLWHVFNMRAPEELVITNSVTKNLYVWAAIIFCIFILAVAFLVPALSGVLGLRPLSNFQFLLSAGASFAPLFAGQIWLAIRAR
jgi:Ca2+-transporting ATPase